MKINRRIDKPKTVIIKGYIFSVPRWANWAAIDKDGDLAVYEMKPTLGENVWAFATEYNTKIRTLASVSDFGDWRESLTDLRKLNQQIAVIPSSLYELRIIPQLPEQSDKIMDLIDTFQRCENGGGWYDAETDLQTGAITTSMELSEQHAVKLIDLLTQELQR